MPIAEKYADGRFFRSIICPFKAVSSKITIDICGAPVDDMLLTAEVCFEFSAVLLADVIRRICLTTTAQYAMIKVQIREKRRNKSWHKAAA